MSHLVPCLSCQRHVDVGDDRCPFCGVALSSEQRASAPPELPRRRLGRAALFTFGATLIGGAACSDGPSGGKDAGSDRPAADGAAGGGGSGTGGSGSGGSGSGGSATGGSGSGGSGSGGRGSGGSGSGGRAGSGGQAGSGGSASGGTGSGGSGSGGTGTGGSIAPPYGIGPLYGAPAIEEP